LVDLSSVRGGENLFTLTGRTYIWATSLNTWLDDPVFGYGLGLWEGEYRATHAPLFPHAHNQFIQTLASAGVVGLLGLLAYLWVAVRSALRAAPVTPIPLLLLAAVLAQCLTNVPLRGQYLLEPLVVVHLLLFAALVNTEKLERGENGDTPGGA
jgi:O-antigen ligase